MQSQPSGDIEKYSGKFTILVADRLVATEGIVGSLTAQHISSATSFPVIEMPISFSGAYSNPVTVIITLQKLSDKFAVLSVPDIIGVCDVASPGIMATGPIDVNFLPTPTSQPLQFVEGFEDPMFFGASQIRIDENGIIMFVSPFFAFPGLGGMGGIKAFTYLYPLLTV